MKMPRKIRTHQPRSFNHVMLRGNYRQTIFHNDTEREKFLAILAECTRKYDFKVHLYCLMTNHIHLLIEINEIPLHKIMLSLTSPYVRYVNGIYQKSGHLFQGRYKRKLVEDESYLLELCYYIHRNPLAANMVNNLDKYQWSSHVTYIGKAHNNWLTTSYILDLLKKHIDSHDNPYQKFMFNRDEKDIKPQFLTLDEDGNVEITDSLVSSKSKERYQDFSLLTLDEIINTICTESGTERTVLSEPVYSRDVCHIRSLITYFAHYHAGYTLKDIAIFVWQLPDSVSRTMHRQIKQGKLQKHIKPLKNALNQSVSQKLS